MGRNLGPGRSRTIPEGDLHFARVEPVVGRRLRSARVALAGLALGEPIVAHLAASGVRHWLWRAAEADAGSRLAAHLRAQHGPALGLEVGYASGKPDALAHPEMGIGVGVAGGTEWEWAVARAQGWGVPALLIAPPVAGRPCRAICLFPEDGVQRTPRGLDRLTGRDSLDRWGWATAAPLCAGLARAILLRGTAHERHDLKALWREGVRQLTLQSADLTLSADAVAWSLLDTVVGVQETGNGRQGRRSFQTPQKRYGSLLIAGLGSLGSVAALHLAPYTDRMVIVDPDRVEAANPVRQAYSVAALGRHKAGALREQLLGSGVAEVVALTRALREEGEVVGLVARHEVRAALVATGTDADFAIARALRAEDVAHVVGRCYPRARYWEAILVDGQRGPALTDLRGHVQLGPAAPPTPEQIAAYSDEGALEAEPATLIESGWAAAWMARLTAQLLAPRGLRERWLLASLAAERTCIIGGVGVESTEDGPAYGIALPGMVRAFSRAEVG